MSENDGGLSSVPKHLDDQDQIQQILGAERYDAAVKRLSDTASQKWHPVLEKLKEEVGYTSSVELRTLVRLALIEKGSGEQMLAGKVQTKLYFPGKKDYSASKLARSRILEEKFMNLSKHS